MATSEDYKFYEENILENDLTKWTKSSGTSVTTDTATLPVGDSISLTITDVEKIRASKYCLLVISLEGNIDKKDNYNSGKDIDIVEYYKVGESIKKRFRKVGFTPYTAEQIGTVYKDSTVLTMRDYDMSKLSITITNNSTNELKIYGIALYRSQDVDTAQLYQAQQKVNNVYGLIIPVYSADPTSPVIGQVWMRGDL